MQRLNAFYSFMSIIVVEKVGGKMKELATIGVADDENEANNLADEAHE